MTALLPGTPGQLRACVDNLNQQHRSRLGESLGASSFPPTPPSTKGMPTEPKAGKTRHSRPAAMPKRASPQDLRCRGSPQSPRKGTRELGLPHSRPYASTSLFRYAAHSRAASAVDNTSARLRTRRNLEEIKAEHGKVPGKGTARTEQAEQHPERDPAGPSHEEQTKADVPGRPNLPAIERQAERSLPCTEDRCDERTAPPSNPRSNDPSDRAHRATAPPVAHNAEPSPGTTPRSQSCNA